MGKKRIITKTEEELLREREEVEAALRREVKVEVPPKVKEGRVYIFSSYNNTIITLTDPQGNVLTWASAGSIGFKGTKKATPFAAQLVAENAGKKAIESYGLKEVEVYVKGPGVGRESAIRALDNLGLKITLIKDITPVPHNGCRPKKRRRV